MTKKDYELIARVLKHGNDSVKNAMDINPITGGDMINTISNYMANELKKDNPRFNRDMFMVACGVRHA